MDPHSEHQDGDIQADRQAQLFSVMPDAVVYGQPDLTITNLNPAAEHMFDISRQEAKGMKLDKVVTIEMVGATRESARQGLWGPKGFWQGESVFTTRTGKKINVLSNLKAIKDQDGASTGWIGVYTDITGLKNAQERLDLAINASAAGIWDWTDIPTGPRWWSPRYFELLGYHDNEIEPSLNTLSSFLHPDDRDRVLAMLDDHMKNNARFELEYRIRTKDGSYKWFLGTAQARFDGNGKAVRMVGSIVDIDKRKKAERIIRQQAELIEMMPDGVIYGDMNNRIVSMNKGAERMFETTSAEAAGKKVEDIMAFKLVGNTRQTARKELEDGRYMRMEAELTSVSGKKMTVLATIKTFEDLIDGAPGWICLYTDISPLRLNEELRSANSYLEQLAFIASHDIKSPISTLSGLNDMLQRSKQLHADDREVLDMQKNVIQQMQRTNKGLNDILQLRRKLMSGDVEEVQTIPVQAMMTNVMEVLGPDIDSSGAELIIDVEGIKDIALPQGLLQSVFYNLASNAIKYRDPQRPLIVRITGDLVDDGAIRFVVEDNGLGFEAEQNTGKVFGIFKRFHSHIEGTGVGLHIVKSIVDAYGGTIVVKSEPGKGSRFELTFKTANFV